MGKQKDLLVSLRDTLQSLNLQQEDIDRLVKEVTQLSRATGTDEELSSGGSSPNRPGRRIKHKTLHESKSTKEKRRDLLVNSTLLYLFFFILAYTIH